MYRTGDNKKDHRDNYWEFMRLFKLIRKCIMFIVLSPIHSKVSWNLIALKVRTHSKKANPNFPSSINHSFYGSPKCLTITFTSFLENECFAGLYPMLRSSSDMACSTLSSGEGAAWRWLRSRRGRGAARRRWCGSCLGCSCSKCGPCFRFGALPHSVFPCPCGCTPPPPARGCGCSA